MWKYEIFKKRRREKKSSTVLSKLNKIKKPTKNPYGWSRLHAFRSIRSLDLAIPDIPLQYIVCVCGLDAIYDFQFQIFLKVSFVVIDFEVNDKVKSSTYTR